VLTVFNFLKFRISVAFPAMLSSPVSPSEFWDDVWIRQTSALSRHYFIHSTQ